MFTASRAPRLVGHSAWATYARRLTFELAADHGNLLIVGPPSSGRTVFGRAIHERSATSRGPFVPVRCDLLSGQLLSSQVFGCAPGTSFASRCGSLGAAQAAEGGTLFLGNMDRLEPVDQWEMLGFLANREVRPFGGGLASYSNARIIASCSPDIFEAVKLGKFDSDLFDALAGQILETVELSARVADIGRLAEHFLAVRCERLAIPAKTLAPSAIEFLSSQPWPGNIGQLQSLMDDLAMADQAETIDHETIRVWLAQRNALPAA